MPVFSHPKLIQHVTANPPVYTNIIERNSRVVVQALDGFYMTLVREHVFGNFFGAGITDRQLHSITSRWNSYDRPLAIWESDADGSELLGDPEGVYIKGGLVNSNAVVLDKDQTDQTHVMQFNLDDQDDELELPLNRWPGGKQYGMKFGMTGVVLYVQHKESNASNVLQWTIRTVNSGGSEVYWDDTAAAWTTTKSNGWNDMGGNTSLTAETFTFNTQSYFKGTSPTGPPHSLLMRPKSDYTDDTSHIYALSVYEPREANQGMRIGTDTASVNSAVVDVPYRCRLNLLAATGAVATVVEIDNRY